MVLKMKYEIIYATADLNKTKELCVQHNVTLVKISEEAVVQCGPETGKKFNVVRIGSNRKSDSKILESISDATYGP